MTLDDVLLHPRTQRLVEKLADNLPHGLIIDGPTGSGVATVARALAHHVGSPDLVLLPKKKVKNEFIVDAQDGSIIIDDIRLLYEQTRTKQRGHQIYIIDTGNKSMTRAAQNAFLKLLEEPRDGVHFIIATHQPDKLLPTITSRTQRLTLLPVTDEQTQDLIDQLTVKDQTKQARLAFVGRGLPALIKRLEGDNELYEARVKIMSDAKAMLGSDLYAKLKIIHMYRDSRADALTLCDDMNHQLRIVIKSQPEPRYVRSIARYLEIRQRIADGGNIRLQLAAGVF